MEQGAQYPAGGFGLPRDYGDTEAEIARTKGSVGIYDVSHSSWVTVTGPSVSEFNRETLQKWSKKHPGECDLVAPEGLVDRVVAVPVTKTQCCFMGAPLPRPYLRSVLQYRVQTSSFKGRLQVELPFLWPQSVICFVGPDAIQAGAESLLGREAVPAVGKQFQLSSLNRSAMRVLSGTRAGLPALYVWPKSEAIPGLIERLDGMWCGTAAAQALELDHGEPTPQFSGVRPTV